MAAFTLYGLPMWSVRGPVGPRPRRSHRRPDDPRGADGARARCDPATTTVVGSGQSGSPSSSSTRLRRTREVTPQRPRVAVWRGDSGFQVSHLRPVQPKLVIDADRDDQAQHARHRAHLGRRLRCRPRLRAADRRQQRRRARAPVQRRRVPGEAPVGAQLPHALGKGAEPRPRDRAVLLAIRRRSTRSGRARNASSRGSPARSTAPRAPTSPRRPTSGSTRQLVNGFAAFSVDVTDNTTQRRQARARALPLRRRPVWKIARPRARRRRRLERGRPRTGPPRSSSTSSRWSTTAATSRCPRTRASTSTASNCPPRRRPRRAWTTSCSIPRRHPPAASSAGTVSVGVNAPTGVVVRVSIDGGTPIPVHRFIPGHR